MSETLPRAFGRYEALAPLGKGGMGEVFIGRLREKGGFTRAVAIKTLLPHLASDAPTAEMFLREARNAACIRHPNVAQTHDLGEALDGSLFFVMDLVHGESLDTLAELSGEVPVSIAVEMVAQAADGLEAAHRATGPGGKLLGLVHCDVSPQNIMVGSDGTVRVVDFGIAKAARLGTSTILGGLRGKMGYVSPEQINGEQVGPETDVFALGIVLWQLITGERLFAGAHPGTILDQVLKGKIKPVGDFRAEVPEDISDVVQWALTRDREARPQSARDFARALRSAAAAGNIPSSADEVGCWVVEVGGAILCERQSIVDSALAMPQLQQPQPQPRRSRRNWIVAVSGFALAGAVALWTQREDPEPHAVVVDGLGTERSELTRELDEPPPMEIVHAQSGAGSLVIDVEAPPQTDPPAVETTQSPIRQRRPSRVRTNGTTRDEREAGTREGAEEPPVNDTLATPVEPPSVDEASSGESPETLIGIDAFDRFVSGGPTAP